MPGDLEAEHHDACQAREHREKGPPQDDANERPARSEHVAEPAGRHFKNGVSNVEGAEGKGEVADALEAERLQQLPMRIGDTGTVEIGNHRQRAGEAEYAVTHSCRLGEGGFAIHGRGRSATEGRRKTRRSPKVVTFGLLRCTHSAKRNQCGIMGPSSAVSLFFDRPHRPAVAVRAHDDLVGLIFGTGIDADPSKDARRYHSVSNLDELGSR